MKQTNQAPTLTQWSRCVRPSLPLGNFKLREFEKSLRQRFVRYIADSVLLRKLLTAIRHLHLFLSCCISMFIFFRISRCDIVFFRVVPSKVLFCKEGNVPTVTPSHHGGGEKQLTPQPRCKNKRALLDGLSRRLYYTVLRTVYNWFPCGQSSNSWPTAFE